MLNYAIAGDMLYDQKSLDPIWIKNFSNEGYVYKLTMPPSFSLFLVWERIVNSFFQVKTDLYFKSISAYYGLLILAIQFYWVSKKNKWLAIASSIVLISSMGFYVKFFLPHIDTLRIYFEMLSFICLAWAVKDEHFFAVLLFGLTSGFAAYTHRIGIVIAVINVFVYSVMINKPLKNRACRVAGVLSLVMATGGAHYLFDLLWGTGAWLGTK